MNLGMRCSRVLPRRMEEFINEHSADLDEMINEAVSVYVLDLDFHRFDNDCPEKS